METILDKSVKDIVNYAAGTDARETVVDKQTGAKISINISDVDEGGIGDEFEPFYIEHGDNFYDPETRKEAEMILSNIRAGKKYPDMPDDNERVMFPSDVKVVAVKPKRSKGKARSRREPPPAGIAGMR